MTSARSDTSQAGAAKTGGGNVVPVSPDLRRNFTMPPKERALECINVLLSLARKNLSISQKRLYAARREHEEKELAQWEWESLHWLRRCGKWSNARRRVEAYEPDDET